MALTLVHDCPHCYTEHAGFTLCGSKSIHSETYANRITGAFVTYQKTRWVLLFTCNACNNPISVKTISDLKQHNDAMKQDGDIQKLAGFSEIEIFPKTQQVDAPQNLPEHIAEAFLEAEDSLRRGKFNSAVAMDRRALELMTKDKAPDQKGTLAKRIEWLESQHELTPALSQWANELRTMGNEAVHGVDGLTDAEAEATHELSRFILTYIYTLPEQVRLAKEKRDAAKQK